LEDAKKALRHSQSLYRALVDNPSYGICRCNADGELLDVNLALLTMLGYASNAELLSANQQSEVIPGLRNDSLCTGLIPETQRIEPVELEWKRKDGTKLRADSADEAYMMITETLQDVKSSSWMSPSSGPLRANYGDKPQVIH
jgi:PAS domain S-box-containing protein